MNTPKITIIIPVYNAEQFLRKCIESIITQNYKNLQVLIINDGSTDKSPQIIEEFAETDDRITFFHKENGGIGSAYKLAFKHIEGDYVLFCDSDDYFTSGSFDDLIDIAAKENPEIIYFGYNITDIQGNEVILKSFKAIDDILYTNEDILDCHFNTIKHPTLSRLYKKDLFSGISVLEQNIGIDEMLTPQLLNNCQKAVYTTKKFYNIVVRQDSVCRAEMTQKKLTETITVNQFICRFVEENIPNYKEYPQLKYLKTLSDLLKQSSAKQLAIDMPTVNIIRKDLNHYYKQLKRSKLFKSESFNYRLDLWLLLRMPNIHRLVHQR